jgi:hypothetical protein
MQDFNTHRAQAFSWTKENKRTIIKKKNQIIMQKSSNLGKINKNVKITTSVSNTTLFSS